MKKVRMALLLLLLLMSTINYYQVSNLFDLGNQELDEEKQLNNRKIPILASNSTVIAERIRNNNQATELQSLGEQNLEKANYNKTMYSGIRLPSYKITTRGPIDIDNDTAFGPSGYKFNGSGTESDPYIIEGYNITDSTTNLIDIQDTTVYFVIRDSILNGITGTNFGINLLNVTHGIIENNTIQNEDIGILLSYLGENITISNNIICNNTETGIVVGSSANNTLSKNTIYNNTMAGIVTNGSDFNVIIENIIYNNTDGMWLDDSANNSILDNQVFNNSQFGCFLRFGGNNTVSGNNIYNNSFLGVHIDLSSYNQIDRNNFIDNDPSRGPDSQAKDNGSSNVFIYNYWNEWTSPDSDSNGYVDDVYWVNGTAGNSDSFPLVSPFAGYIPHIPIYIDDNTDFETLGFPGSGIEGDPYIIEGYNITDGTTELIYLLNTNAYFIIRNCLLNGVTGTNFGIILTNVVNGFVEQNIINNCQRSIYVQGSASHRNTISKNTIFNSSWYGIVLSSSTHNNSIIGNTVFNSSQFGIMVNNVYNNTLENNIVYNNSDWGITVDSSDNNTLINNTIFKNVNIGIQLGWSDNNTLIDNKIFNHSQSGIQLWSSNNNSLFGNVLTNNNQFGILFSSSSENNASRNTLDDNTQYGISVDSSSIGNTLEWNHFFRNKLGGTQASDAGSGNIFTYNYWDDHPGPDSEPDGIFDSPYNVDGGSNDDPYPLAYPYLPHEPIFIDGNINFGTLELMGKGTAVEPYLIEDYYISNSTEHLIHIRNTDAYFVIQNSLLNGIDRNPNNYSIYLYNVSNAVIANNIMFNSDCGTFLTQLSTYNNITSNFIYNNSVSGIRLSYSANYTLFSNNTIFDNDNSGVYLSDFANNNSCINNTIYNNSLHGIRLTSVKNNIVTNNTIFNCAPGIYLFSSINNYLFNNTIYQNSDGINLRASTDNTLAGNIIYNNTNDGIYFGQSGSQNTTYNTVHNNTVSNNLRCGIYLEGSVNYTTITNNTIHSNTDSGIRLWFSPCNNTISNNTIYNNGLFSPGISLYYSAQYNNVTNNNIYDNPGRGIILEDSCNDNFIAHNIIINNAYAGVTLTNCINNNISDNTISNNEWGIYLYTSVKNSTIYGNTIYNNSRDGIILGGLSGLNLIYLNNILNNNDSQVNDENGANTFYYNGLGNYWGSAYTGSDANNDGIGDTPYTVSGTPGNIDPYPLMYPAERYLSLKASVIEGDWDVIGPESRQNEIITLNGNLNIQSGGNLTLNNVILRFNCSFDGQYHVEVFSGGILTIKAKSVVTAVNISNVWYFRANGGSDIDLMNSNFNYAGWEQGVVGEHSGVWISTDGALILNCTFYRNYYGLNLYQANNCTITDNTITNSTEYGVFISQSVSNTLFKNTIKFNPDNGIVLTTSSDNNIISYNNISYNGLKGGLRGINIWECSHNRILNNNIFSNTENGISIGHPATQNNTFIYNNIFDNGGSGIKFIGISNNFIINNTISFNTEYGLWLDSASNNNTLFNNTLYNNSQYAIYVRNSNITDISRNTIFNQAVHGILLQSSSYNNVTENVIHNNFDGISQGNSMKNYFIANAVYNNSMVGISSWDSENSTIMNNFIAHNYGFGVFCDSTTTNVIVEWNSFISNNPTGNSQANDVGINNKFSYNYWDDHTSPDTNPIDGIVDDPYVFDGGNSDDYPLAYPYFLRDPIYITDNANFSALGFPGNGTQSDPYIIEYYTIINSTTHLISIENTTAYFIIRNNLLIGISGSFNGIYLYNATQGNITNNIIQSTYIAVYLVNSSKMTLSSNDIFDNSWVGIGLGSSSNSNTICHNIIYNNIKPGIYLENSSKNIITNNTIFNTSFTAIVMSNSANYNNFSSNKIFNNDHHGIYFEDFCNFNTIFNNTVYNNSWSGIVLNSSSNNNLSYNNVFNNTENGIWLESSSNNNIYYNNIFNHSINGILVSNSHKNEFYNNVINNNTDHGIRLDSDADNNSFVNNIISNHMTGIYLLSSNNTVIIGNKLINNTDVGIFFEPVSNNSIVEWNAFVNTGGSHAIDDGSNNQFQFNYWEGHTSPDSNFDGIVDIPYPFTTNNDPYPLTKPYTSHEPIFINNNANFTTLGFPGNGSLNNPYIVENYYIINPTTTLIRIQDTTAHFIIRNNLLFSLTGISDGIFLSSVRNGIILDNIIHGARYGIYLASSINNTLSSNTIYNNSLHGVYLISSNDNIIFNNKIYNSISRGIGLTYSNNNNLSQNIIFNSSEYGILLFNSNSSSIFNNTIYNNTLDGITLTNSTTSSTVFNNTVFNNSRNGITLAYSSTGNNISFNDIYGNLGTGIVLYLYCSSNILSNNNITSNFKAGIGIVDSSSNNILSNNYIFNNSWNGIGLINSSNNNIISFNEIHHNLWNGIFMNASSSHNTLSDNTLYNNSENGLLLESSAFNNTVVSNSIYNNSLDGIAIDSAHNNTLLNNVIQDHFRGISLAYSHNTTCSYNSIYNSSFDSIRLYYANFTTIIGNNVSNNAFAGITLGFSYHNIIINNTFSNNNLIGMYIGYSSFNLVMFNLISNHLNDTYGIGIMVTASMNNTIRYNTISDNINFGIVLGPNSANNTIKWNDFLDNNPNNTMGLGPSQAYDNGTSNLFTNNFWSDWTSPDTNPEDGIVDKPYSINGSASNFDLYPLAITAIHDLSIPTVRYPNDGGMFNGVIILQWDPAIDSWTHSVTYTLFYSSDGGGTWTLLYSGWTNTNYPWDTTSPLVPNGANYLIRVNATCLTGSWKVDTSDFVFTINNVLDDSTPPEITVFPSNHSYVELTVGHNLTWSATDQFPDTYTIWRNNTPIPNYINVDWFNNTPITINIDNLSPGLYIYKIKFLDSSGNPSTHVVGVTVTENAPPIVMITEPEQDDILDGTIAIAWTAIDPEGEPMTYSVDYWNGNSWINLAPSLSTTSITWDTTIVIDRPDYKIRVNASDGYKIGVNESGFFTIDNIESFAQIPAGFTSFEVTDEITVGLDVKNTVNVTINRISDSDVPDPPSDLESLNIYLNITLSDEDALNDLWINISFDELNGRDPNNVKIYYYNEDDERWLEAKETGVDFDNEVVWAWTDHLTLFGVMDEQTQPADNWLTLLLMAIILIAPVIVVTVFIYRRAKKRMRMKKAKAEIRQSQIDLGILTRDLDKD